MKNLIYISILSAGVLFSTACKKKHSEEEAQIKTVTATTSTFAGSGATGGTNGTGIAATFNLPSGLAIDAAGNVYVSEHGNHTIRKITPAGVVTTFAGAVGISGATNSATATDARFNAPHEICMDSHGNIFVADMGNSQIRKITPAGVVTTFAGSTTAGHVDATGTAARFNSPIGIVCDNNDNLYVSDTDNSIRKITSTGVVTTLAGSTAGYLNATGTSARFTTPCGMTLDASGNLYVCDQGNNRIRKITPAGVVTTFAGSTPGYLDGQGESAQFNALFGIYMDSDNYLYVADHMNNTIRKVSLSGEVTTFAGNGTSGVVNGTGPEARFEYPTCIKVDGNGVMYVSEYYGNRIRKIVRTEN